MCYVLVTRMTLCCVSYLQQELVTKLRESLSQLQDANRDQEHTLLETNSKLDMAQQNHYVLESTLAQIRSLLHGVEQRRQRPFFDSDPVPKQSVSLLAHTLERYIQVKLGFG